MHFEQINETGTTKRVTTGSLLFSFEYKSRFYGSCTLVAKVHEIDGGGLLLDENSATVENYELQKGSLPVLVNSAKIFFKRMLSRCSSVAQLDNDGRGNKKLIAIFHPFSFLRSLKRKVLIPSATSSATS